MSTQEANSQNNKGGADDDNTGEMVRNLSQHDVDELTLAQQNALREEQATLCPLIAPAAPIATALLDDVASEPTLLAKAKQIAQKYKRFQKVRRDGNCFIRGAVYMMLLTALHDVAVARRLLRQLQSLRSGVAKQFGEFAEDFCDVAEEYFGAVLPASARKSNNSSAAPAIKDEASLIATVSDPDTSEYLVCAFRYYLSIFIRQNADNFMPYMLDYPTPDAFCQAEVETVGKDSDQIHLAAFCQLFAPMRIVIEYMDASSGAELNTITFAEDGKKEEKNEDEEEGGEGTGRAVQMFFVYRPGHYDLAHPV